MALPEPPERVKSLIAHGALGLPRRALRILAGRPVVVDGQQLDAEVQLLLKLLALAGNPAAETLSVADARAQLRSDIHGVAGPAPAVARVEAVTVPGPAGPMDARLYVPHALHEPSGLLVYFHGGGFLAGDLDTHDHPCRLLAREAGVRVLSVDYRRPPEHPFPAAAEDALAAFTFAAEHADRLGADPALVAVGGDSAGGNLAAGITLLTASGEGPAPAFQLLIYPWLDLSRKRDSYALFGERFLLTESALDWYSRHYLPEPERALDQRCSPLLSDQLAGVPPAYIATAGFDPLRDDGEDYARKLRAAGVPVALRRHAGLIHGFVNMTGIGHTGRDALLQAAGALRVGLAMAAGGTG